jgi:biotin transport system substrate-specific component
MENAATLRVAVFPRAGWLTDAVLVLGGALFVAAAAQFSISIEPFSPVPITGQTFAVLLVGASYGALLGSASLALYVLMGLFLPFYADGDKGWDQLKGVTGGYLVGFVLAAAVVGLLAQMKWDRKFSSAVSAMLTGSVIIYVCGIAWLMHEADLNFTTGLKEGLAPFVPGDIVKLYLAGALLPGAWALVKRFRGRDDAE